MNPATVPLGRETEADLLMVLVVGGHKAQGMLAQVVVLPDPAVPVDPAVTQPAVVPEMEIAVLMDQTPVAARMSRAVGLVPVVRGRAMAHKQDVMVRRPDQTAPVLVRKGQDLKRPAGAVARRNRLHSSADSQGSEVPLEWAVLSRVTPV